MLHIDFCFQQQKINCSQFKQCTGRFRGGMGGAINNFKVRNFFQSALPQGVLNSSISVLCIHQGHELKFTNADNPANEILGRDNCRTGFKILYTHITIAKTWAHLRRLK